MAPSLPPRSPLERAGEAPADAVTMLVRGAEQSLREAPSPPLAVPADGTREEEALEEGSLLVRSIPMDRPKRPGNTRFIARPRRRPRRLQRHQTEKQSGDKTHGNLNCFSLGHTYYHMGSSSRQRGSSPSSSSR